MCACLSRLLAFRVCLSYLLRVHSHAYAARTRFAISPRSTLDEDAIEDMYLDLSVMYTDSATEKTHVLELRPGGSQLDVNTENVDEYIELVTRWTMLDRITDEVGAFIGGVCVGAPMLLKRYCRTCCMHLFYFWRCCATAASSSSAQDAHFQ